MVRRKTGVGVVRPSLLLLHLVSGEDPFARALCQTRPYGKRGRGWSAPLDDPPTCRVCAGKRWLSQKRRTRRLEGPGPLPPAGRAPPKPAQTEQRQQVGARVTATV